MRNQSQYTSKSLIENLSIFLIIGIRLRKFNAMNINVITLNTASGMYNGGK